MRRNAIQISCHLLLVLCILNVPCTARAQEAQASRPSAFATVAAAPLGSRATDKSPVVVLFFCDFESFPCRNSASVAAGLLGKNEDVQFIFKHAPATTNANAFLAHEAALAAGSQGKFWEMYNLLFENQSRLSRADLLGYAEKVGLNIAAFQQALDSHSYRPVIERDLAEARGLGVTATPTFFVNGRRLVGPQGYASLEAVVASALAGIPKSQRAQNEIAAPGPMPVINVDHAPSDGLATATIRVIEFSDFECPFCAKAAPVVRQLVAAFPTQVRVVFKHFPLPMHKEAPLAHEAAMAAAEQGKFWEMHDALRKPGQAHAGRSHRSSQAA